MEDKQVRVNGHIARIASCMETARFRADITPEEFAETMGWFQAMTLNAVTFEVDQAIMLTIPKGTKITKEEFQRLRVKGIRDAMQDLWGKDVMEG